MCNKSSPVLSLIELSSCQLRSLFRDDSDSLQESSKSFLYVYSEQSNPPDIKGLSVRYFETCEQVHRESWHTALMCSSKDWVPSNTLIQKIFSTPLQQPMLRLSGVLRRP